VQYVETTIVIQSALACVPLVLTLAGTPGSGFAIGVPRFGTRGGPVAETAVRRLAAQSPWDNPNTAPPLPVAVKKKKPKPAPAKAPVRPKAPSATTKAPASGRSQDARDPQQGQQQEQDGQQGQPSNEGEAPATGGRSHSRRPPIEDTGRAEPQQNGEDSEDSEEEEAEAPARPKSRASRRKAARARAESDAEAEGDGEDDEEEAEPALDALPVIVPRLVSLQLGPSMSGRNFHFNSSLNPPLQSESSFPRIGVAVELQAYPLLLLPRGFYRLFGANISYERDSGQAAVPQGNGSTNSFPAVQSRFQLDVRYPFFLGQSFLIAPAVGYATTSFDLKRNTPVLPSMCPKGFAEACIPDVAVSHLVVDVNLRVAATASLGLSLTAGYLHGTGVRQGITSESRATASGYHGDLGATVLVNDWLAVVGKVNYWNNAFAFSDGSFGYKTASEIYYGGTVGLSAFTK
jgi:hypothetical protein